MQAGARVWIFVVGCAVGCSSNGDVTMADETGSTSTTGSSTSTESSSSSTGSSTTSASGSTTAGDESSSTGAPSECTDAMAASYMACIEQADFSNPEAMACQEGCSTVQGDGCDRAACQWQCTIDHPFSASIQECYDKYPACAPVADLECSEACWGMTVDCFESDPCEYEQGRDWIIGPTVCDILAQMCYDACMLNATPIDYGTIDDGSCHEVEAVALDACVGEVGCDGIQCGYGSQMECVDCSTQAECQMGELFQDAACEAGLADCPSSNAACRYECYAAEYGCLDMTCETAMTCGAQRDTCLEGC